MSSVEGKKTSKAKANLVAAWEWFKSAAWLQVLLIVGIVVAIVVSIPYIVTAISNQTTTSEFFARKRIYYNDFLEFINGEDDSCNGPVGSDSYNNTISDDKDGFVVMFYKANCDQCDTLQPILENFFDEDLTMDGVSNLNDQLKFYTIDVSWVPDESQDSTEAEGNDLALYENEYITLDEQFDVQQNVKNVYLRQPEKYKNSAVTEETLNTQLNTLGGGTLPTPMFVFYTKDKSESTYDISNPTKVICGMEGTLSNSSAADVATQMLDIYNFQAYSGE